MKLLVNLHGFLFWEQRKDVDLVEHSKIYCSKKRLKTEREICIDGNMNAITPIQY